MDGEYGSKFNRKEDTYMLKISLILSTLLFSFNVFSQYSPKIDISFKMSQYCFWCGEVNDSESKSCKRCGHSI